MNYFIAYDIADPRRLSQTARVLENYGWRIQYSFFQCELEKDVLAELEKKLCRIIDEKEDSLIIQPLCADCMNVRTVIGTGDVVLSRGYELL